MPIQQHQPETLQAVRAHLWGLLLEGAACRQSPFHQGVLATLSDRGPEARHVVLRQAEPEHARLSFHTDRRSPKIGQLKNNARACWCFFGANVQLRLTGIARQALDAQRLDAAWARLTDHGRRCYSVESAPGAVLTDAGHGQHGDSRDSDASLALARCGRPNFALVEFGIEHIDWLHLAGTHHRRAQFEARYGWQGRWVQP